MASQPSDLDLRLFAHEHPSAYPRPHAAAAYPGPCVRAPDPRQAVHRRTATNSARSSTEGSAEVLNGDAAGGVGVPHLRALSWQRAQRKDSARAVSKVCREAVLAGVGVKHDGRCLASLEARDQTEEAALRE